MIDAYGIHAGTLYIRFYALIILSGIMVGGYLTIRRAKRTDLDPAHVWNGLIWAMIPGLIGARIYHILTPSPASGLTTLYYLQNPFQMLAIWNGGLGIYGGIAGGLVGIYLYAKYRQQPLLRWIDLAVPGMFIGQAIGRWGNFINHELYGAPSTLPWAIEIPLDKRLPGYEQYSTFHPLFLYEALWNIGSCCLILWFEHRYRHYLKPGDLLLFYLILFPLSRFLLDFVRLDSNGLGIFTTAQLLSVLIALIALGILVARHRKQEAFPPDQA